MFKRGAAVAVCVVLWASAALGQEQSTQALDYGGNEAFFRAVQGFTALKWEPVKKDATVEEVKTQLERAGWDTGTVLESLEGGTKFDLYQKAVAPGQIGYMALPKAGKDAEPATFLPMDTTDLMAVKAGFFGASKSYSGDEIRAELVRGIQTGIDTFCGMTTKPSSVKMTVSAFGVVDVEATWDTSQVCSSTQ